MTCLDDEVLNELHDILEDELNRVALEFVRQFREEVAKLRDGSEEVSCEQIARTAHLLKGSAGNLGATALATQLVSVERAARAGDGELAWRELSAAEELSETCFAELAAKGLLPEMD